MKLPDMTGWCRTAIGVLFLFAVPPLSAGVYYWIDENGVKHYSNVAPSESGQDVKQLEEVPQEEPEVSSPASPADTAPAESAAGEAPAVPPPEPEKKTAEEDNRSSASQTDTSQSLVPTEQSQIVENEKSVARELQRQLEQNASQRDQIIEQERERLVRALEQLRKTPLSEFGSQKNKRTAIGYYQNRLEALQNSPDTYFAYGDSDIY